MLSNTQISHKLLSIEKKLSKFPLQKQLHESKAMEERKKAEEREREWLMTLRGYEIEKIKQAHQYQIEQDKRIYQFWQNTEKIKHDRQLKDTKFTTQMNQRIKDQVNQKREFEKNDVQESLNYFIQTCIRQGIELKHDADRPPQKVEKAEISTVAIMMKIRERTQKNAEAQKAREKRHNKMMVEQQRQQQEVEAKKREEELIDRFCQQCTISNAGALVVYNSVLRAQMQTTERQIKEIEVRAYQMEKFDEMQKISRQRELETLPERKRIWRENQLHYMEINLEKKIRKRAKHTQQIEAIVQSILDLTEQCYKQQGTSQQLEFRFWRELMEKWQNTFIEPLPIQNDVMNNQSVYELGQSQDFFQYYCGGGEWRPTHFYQTEDKAIFNRPFINQDLGEFLFEVVDIIHPKQAVKDALAAYPSYLPLKISLVGGKFSGRKTLANYLSQRYGLEIIIPEHIIKEALLEAFPPVEDPNDKKKKKDAKKVEEEKKENPQLKALGIKIKEVQDRGENLPDELMTEIVLYKISTIYQPIEQAQIQQEVQTAKQLEKQRLEDVQKVEVPVPSKKIAPLKKIGKVDIPPPQEGVLTKEDHIKNYYNKPKAFAYTKGFVIVGFPETYSQAKIFEEAVSGYVPEEERLNSDAEKLKKKIQEVVSPAPPPPQTNLLPSALDQVLFLTTPLEERLRRQTQRRIDPTTETIYNLEENPPPTDVKGLVERLQTVTDPSEQKDALQQAYEYTEQNLEGLQEWCSQFGINNSISAIQIVKVENQKSYEVAANVDQLIGNKYNKQIGQILTLKAPQYEDETVSIPVEQIQESPVEQSQQQQQQSRPVSSIQAIISPKRPPSSVAQGGLSSNRVRSPVKPSEHQSQSYSYIYRLFDRNMSEVLLKQWLLTQHSYSKDITTQLKRMNQSRKRLIVKINELQKNILEVLQQPDNKVTKLVAFQENFNKFLDENPDLSKQKNAKAELHKHLDILYESLWDVIDKKRTEALHLFETVIKQPQWVENEMNVIIQNFLMMLQYETNLLSEMTEIVANSRAMIRGIQVPELGEHFILEPFDKEQVPAWKDNESPQVDQIFSYFISQLDLITRTVLENKEKFMLKRSNLSQPNEDAILEDRINQMVYTQRAIAIYRAHVLRNIAISRIRELMVFRQLLFNRIDDWIIFGLKRENDYIYEVIKYFRVCIDERQFAAYQRTTPKEIVENFHMVLQNFNIYRPILPSYEVVVDSFTLSEWYQWSEELRSIADERQLINVAIFDQYFDRRVKSQSCMANIPSYLKHLNGQLLSKKFPQPGFQNVFQLQPLLVSTLLINSYLPSSEQITQYIDDLRAGEGENIEEFCEVIAWFDETEAFIDNDQEMQTDRAFFVKRFLYDSCRTLDQLQLNLTQLGQVLKIFEDTNRRTFKDFLSE